MIGLAAIHGALYLVTRHYSTSLETRLLKFSGSLSERACLDLGLSLAVALQALSRHPDCPLREVRPVSKRE